MSKTGQILGTPYEPKDIELENGRVSHSDW